MVVLASNTPEQLDRAIHDRLDEMILFDRPGESQRLQMIYHYLIKYCMPVTSFKDKMKRLIDYPRTLLFKKTEIGMQGIENSHIEAVAKKCDGFSGREIYKLVIAWHDAAFS
jgi:ATPase family AAA domain-containing protein 3A/B